VIRALQARWSDLDAKIEIRNQARVHLWYPEKHGLPYPTLARATDGIDRFLTVETQVGGTLTMAGYRQMTAGGYGSRLKPGTTAVIRVSALHRKRYRSTPEVKPARRRGGLISFFRKQCASLAT
jgi:hypothetical protein